MARRRLSWHANPVDLQQPLDAIVADAIAVCAPSYVRPSAAGNGWAVVLDSDPPVELVTLETEVLAEAWQRSRGLSRAA